MEQKKLTSYDLASGVSARNYRKKLASFSVNPADSILTLKFRLEHSDDLHKKIPFSRFRDLYDVVEGVGKGSLIYFLFSVILSGFRIFATFGDAQTFSNRNLFRDDDFYDDFHGATGLELPDFIPSLIKKRLVTEVRATRGKDNRFVKEVIVSEYRRSLASKLTPETDENKVERLFDMIAKGLINDKRLNGWKDLKSNLIVALEAVDKAVADFCGEHQVPSIASMLSNGNSKLPPNSTIAFDDSSVHINADDEYAPYFVVAAILRHFDGADASNNILRKYVQDNLTTNTNSGLSWLFNNGLDLLRTTSLDELCRSYAISPSRRESMRQLQDAAKAIPEQTLLFNGKNALSFAVFRSVIGGHLDSWVANYINRLYELKNILSGMPDNLMIPDALVRDGADFIDTTNCNREDTELLCRRFNGDNVKRTLSALDNLLGNSSAASAEDILQIESCTEQLNQLRAFREQIKKMHWCRRQKSRLRLGKHFRKRQKILGKIGTE